MLTITRALIEDSQAITDIKTEAYNKELNTYLGRNGGPPGYDKVESQQVIINKFITYKVLLDDRIIGAFFLKPVNEFTVCFEDFAIHPDFQGKGYGLQTMKMIENIHNEYTVWKLSTPIFSVGNQHLYTKLGYIETSRDEFLIKYEKVVTG